MRLHNETNYDIRILQRKIIGNLEAIDQVCREHGLRYYLWAGTMLGAVRHKGFIPWDDDMDICMPRPDYEQLIAHWREWLPQPYEVIAPETDPTYPYPFAKIEDASTTVLERPDFKFLEGVYIDTSSGAICCSSVGATPSNTAMVPVLGSLGCCIRYGRWPTCNRK